MTEGGFVNTDSTRRQQIVASLSNKESRDAFVDAEISTTVSFQIREMRKARDWTQEELANRIGSDQPTISKFEDPDYATFAITSLKRLASAFDVALAVRFVPFSQLVDDTVSSTTLAVPSYGDDLHLDTNEKASLHSDEATVLSEQVSITLSDSGHGHFEDGVECLSAHAMTTPTGPMHRGSCVLTSVDTKLAHAA